MSEKISEALERRLFIENLKVKDEKSAFRLVNNLYDGLSGINIDIYGNEALIHFYSIHWKVFLKNISNLLLEIKDRKIEGVYVVDRSRKTTKSGLNEVVGKSICIAGKKPENHRIVIEENGIKYHITLNNGPAVGLYLDQRENRQKVFELMKSIASNKETNVKPTILNTFCFTCSFSIPSAKFANCITTNIDASKSSLSWAKDNFFLNGIDPNDHIFLENDAFVSMHKLFSESKLFDMIILDPPTVSRVRIGNRVKTFTSYNNYTDAISLAARLVSPNGYIVAFVNTHTLDKDHWKSSIKTGLSSIIPFIKEKLEEERLNLIRSYLRKKGVKQKFRPRILKNTNKNVITDELINQLYQFDIIDEWFQDTNDFPYLQDDQMGKYLHGMVIKRRDNKFNIPPIEFPEITTNILSNKRQPKIDPKNEIKIKNSNKNDQKKPIPMYLKYRKHKNKNTTL